MPPTGPPRKAAASRSPERTEDAAWRRIGAAGGVTTSLTTFAAELTGDFTTALGGATLGIVYETIGG